MGYSFVTADRDQVFLMPPDVREWLSGSDLVWTVLDAVEQMDLSAFRAQYRADGRSRPAYDPGLMVALLLFAYCDGVRSSRQIERHCARDVGYRVISGNLGPDHATIARFRARHRAALAGVFTQVLRLCAEAGLVRVGLVALDGTKLRGNARGTANRTRAQIEAEIAELTAAVETMLAEADQVDATEDAAQDSASGGDDPPAGLAERRARLARLREAKARLDAEDKAAQDHQDQRRADWTAAKEAGTKVGRRPGPRPPKGARNHKVNLVDPDSRIMKTHNGFCQGYNGQIVVGAGQIILAAGVLQSSTDNSALHPMLGAAQDQLDAAGVDQRIRGAVADAGYGGKTNLASDTEITLLVATASGRKKADTAPPKDPNVAAMTRRLQTPLGRRLYRRRAGRVEPVFGQIKNRLGPHLDHRGIDAVTTEWNLITTSHNLLKYWRAQAPSTA